MARFEKQKARERLLAKMLKDFNEGRSKRYYCIAAAVLRVDELERASKTAQERSQGLDARARSRLPHSILDEIAQDRGYCLRLRKSEENPQ
ncbi:MAG: hypothetical protein AB1576_14125 [Bacillota bacterium]